ncbi:calmodulin-binding protein [Streptomyces sp. RKAG290]|uniref:BP74-related protein n=1 Tax=Streptomyces sp. RKAG290 TaxID=2888348 RepID=UPI0020348992|nr:calmodulin-binding protein [Streptomyces sp. RKAG290]MCM2412582.1 calmodulin-binding protein [Streptomyces sp. RKAG290]
MIIMRRPAPLEIFMRHLFTKAASLAAVATLAFTVAQPAQANQIGGGAQRADAAATPAYFEMTDITRSTFIVKLVNDREINHARELVSGATEDEPHLVGRIIKSPAAYNPRWSFHFDPDSVQFFNNAIEVCDATIPYVEDHLDEAGGPFLPGRYFCPWTSRLVREVAAP